MVDRVGTGSTSLARAAIEAALARQAKATQAVARGVGGAPEASPAKGADFGKALVDGLKQVDAEVKRADALSEDMLAGRITDLSEVAAQLKQSELSLRFALEVRNKFIDAYREVMRMSV